MSYFIQLLDIFHGSYRNHFSLQLRHSSHYANDSMNCAENFHSCSSRFSVLTSAEKLFLGCLGLRDCSIYFVSTYLKKNLQFLKKAREWGIELMTIFVDQFLVICSYNVAIDAWLKMQHLLTHSQIFFPSSDQCIFFSG